MPNRSSSSPTHAHVLLDLFAHHFGQKADHIKPLPSSGSRREYFRLTHSGENAIGVFNPNARENESYSYFTHHFLNLGIHVPKLFGKNLEQHCYLIEDLGDETLYSHMLAQKQTQNFPRKYYETALKTLAFLQTRGGEGLNPNKFCAARKRFDKPAILWDLNYFKYYFLKLGHFSFDENRLEADFQAFASQLNEENSHTFFYRDFQARNIMLNNQTLYFIDFQDGRFGPVQYDVASLLFQAKAELSPDLRESLLQTYLQQLSQYTLLDEKKFRVRYHDFVLIRILQTLGAYGFKGYVERKPHFLSSFPFALKNIKWLLENGRINATIPYLKTLLRDIAEESLSGNTLAPSEANTLTVTINSFSYKNQIPIDYSGNGGGFVFDCRSLPNPGRLEEYQHLTGRDKPVIDYLKKSDAAQDFLKDIMQIADRAVQNYIDRGFHHLMINFGCTGGQHRSVYCAEALASHLKKAFSVEIALTHIEQEKKGWIN